ENPTNLTLSNNSVEENSPINTLIGDFTTTDPDTGNTFSYSLVSGTGDTDNSLFTIDGNQLKTNGIFDYETQNNYSIRVKTTDQGGLSYEKQLTVNVTDVNENPTNLTLSNNSVEENSLINTLIGSF
ncbi:MAG: cadherin repeat domain-containing protein, partial [Microcystis panniformis]